MRVSVDLRTVESSMHGIARFGVELVRELFRILPDVDWLVICSRNAPLSRLPLPEHGRHEIVRIKPYTLHELTAIPALLERRQVDLHLSTTYTAPVFSRVPFIFTIHDLIHLRCPEHYGLRHRLWHRFVTRRACRKAAAILTVSQASKSDIVSFFGADPERIVVLGNACSKGFEPGDPDQARRLVVERTGVEGPFLLWVGNEKPHKNLDDALRIVQRLRERGRNVKLITCGVSEDTLARHEGRLGADGLATPCGHVDDSMLIALYRACDVFLMPSLIEGFGIPVLEAMSCGAPVVAYDTSSIPEVLGDAGALVPPGDTNAAAGAVAELLDNSALADERRRLGIKRAARFNWSDYAGAVASLIRNVEYTAARILPEPTNQELTTDNKQLPQDAPS